MSEDPNKTTGPNISVPLDYWPSILSTPHAAAMPAGTLGGHVLSNGVAALGAIHDTVAKIAAAKRATFDSAPPVSMDGRGRVVEGAVVVAPRSGTAAVTGREAELDRAMMIAFDRCAPKVENSLKAMKQHHVQLEQKLVGVFKEDQGSLPTAGEVRHHFKSKKDAERLPAALQAIKTGDEVEALWTAKSLLRPAPSYLSGFTTEQLRLLREAAARRFAPELHDQLERSEKIINHVESARASFVKKFASMRPKVTKKAAAADTALAALAGVK
jgi:hypothetical protein